jgi:peptidoglycan/LPS O-acetylase OafA/YrhL
MSLATILIMLFLGLACLAALVAAGAIVYQLFQKFFRKRKSPLPNEITNPPSQ